MSEPNAKPDDIYQTLALASYVGEQCVVCGQRLEMADLYHAKAATINPGRLAHLRCWRGCMAVIRNAVDAASLDFLVSLAQTEVQP